MPAELWIRTGNPHLGNKEGTKRNLQETAEGSGQPASLLALWADSKMAWPSKDQPQGATQIWAITVVPLVQLKRKRM